MPAFEASLSSDAIWTLVQFLRAVSDAAAWTAGDNDQLAPSRAVTAPDFTFELSHRGQQTLTRSDQRRDTLLVLVSLPESLARVASLVADQDAFNSRQIEVIAVTSTPAEARAAVAQTPDDVAVIAITSPDVAAAYTMFAENGGAVASRHAEFLIDRDGRILAQWRGLPVRAEARNREIFAAAAKGNAQSPAPPPAHEHAH
jgi:peroxiredoxin